MKEKKSKLKVVIISLITLIILPIVVNVISHKIEDINFLEKLKNIFMVMLNFFSGIVNFKIPLWIIIVGIVMVIFIMKVYFHNKNKFEIKNEHEWEKYNIEEYKGLRYTWKCDNYLGKKVIKELKPICECGCDLIVTDSYKNYHKIYGYLVCPNCNKGYENNFDENKEAVEKIIVFKYNNMIEKYNNSILDIENVNLNDLVKEEKELIQKFYNKNLKQYINKKVAINANKYSDAIESLTARNVFKGLNDYEIIENYTSDGTLFELTEAACNKLNNR